MVLLSLMHFSAFSLCFLVLTITTIPHQAQASSHGSFGRKQVGGYPTVDVGICASSVIVYGYKCQELQVNILMNVWILCNRPINPIKFNNSAYQITHIFLSLIFLIFFLLFIIFKIQFSISFYFVKIMYIYLS